MDKEIWKKVFRIIPDKRLVGLIHKWNIQIKGFRSINNSNIKVVRSRVLNEMLKPKKLKKIVEDYENAFSEETQNDQGEAMDPRDASIEELMEKFEEGMALDLIFGGLFASKDENHHAKAGEFEQALLEKYDVQSLEELIEKECEQDDIQKESNEEKIDWKKKWEKTTALIDGLKQRIEELEQKNSRLKTEHKNEKKEWIKEKAQLQQKAGNAKAETRKVLGQYAALEEENKKLAEKIEQLKKENSHLHARILCLEQNSTDNEQNKKNDQGEDVLHVLLIGDPKNKSIARSENPKFKIISAEDSLEADLTNYREIWMLNYLVPPQFKNKIIERSGEKVKEFHDFLSFKSYIKRGSYQ